jgi:hypothetical protein
VEIASSPAAPRNDSLGVIAAELAVAPERPPL